jgi:hypothetical protein
MCFSLTHFFVPLTKDFCDTFMWKCELQELRPTAVSWIFNLGGPVLYLGEQYDNLLQGSVLSFRNKDNL